MSIKLFIARFNKQGAFAHLQLFLNSKGICDGDIKYFK